MKKSCLAIFALLSVILTSACSASEFSAKFVEKRGIVTVNGMQYVKGANVRKVVAIDGIKQVIISRADKAVTWQLYPEHKTYIETPGANGDMSKQIAVRAKRLAEVQKAGTEKIQNLVCDKYIFKYKTEQSGVGTQWVAQKLGWPIKTEIKAEMGDTLVEVTNIKIEKQPDKLFEVPKDYRKIETPGSKNQKPK